MRPVTPPFPSPAYGRPEPRSERYSAVSRELYALFSGQGVILEASGAWRSALGQGFSEVVGRPLSHLMDAAEAARLRQALADVTAGLVAGGVALAEVTTRCRHSDGTSRLVAWRLAACPDEESIAASGIILPEQPGNTTAVPDTAARFRAAQEASPDGFMLFRSVRDAQERIVDFVCLYANPAAARLTNRAAGELEGKSLLGEFPGNAAEGLFDAYARVVDTSAPWQGETTYAHDGLDTGFRITAVKQADGLALTFSDITERLQAQAQLQADRTRFFRLFQLSPAFICTLRGPDHVFEIANDAYYQLVGVRDIIGRPVREAIPEASSQGFTTLLDRVLATGEAYVANHMPVKLQRTSNAPAEWRHVSFVYLPLLEADGSRSGIFVHGVDVTEHVRAVDALRDSQGRFEQLSANVPGMVFQYALHPDGTDDFPYVSEGARRIFDLAPHEIRRDPAAAVGRVHSDDRGHYERSLALSAATLEPWEWEGRVVGASGTLRWVRGAARPERQPDGSIVWDGVLLDVGERRRAEDALRRSEARFRTMIEHAADLVVILDATCAIRYANVPFALGLGYPAEEIVGESALTLVHPDDLARAKVAFQAVIIDAVPLRLELRVRHQDGTWRLLDLLAHSLLGDPDVAGIVVSGRDVTEHRQLEAQARQSQRIEAVGNLAGGIAHDFNNLITVIKVHGEFVLEDTPQTDLRYADLIEIGKAADRAAGLTRQLLAFSRKQILNPQPVDVNDILRNLGGMLSRLIGEDIETVVTLAPDLGIVLADAGQLEQVVINLAVNARDAMPEGGRLTIATRNMELDGLPLASPARPLSGRFAELVVSDSGTGMPAEVRSRIFEPFFTTKEPGRGTGLGLSTVYGIVKQSNGYIWCDSEPGVGTTFTICLPLVERFPAPASTDDETPDMPGSGTVLLVEDEAAVRALASRILLARGYQVLEAANGVDALALAESHDGPIDLLLTDAVMPRMGGAELARAMRARRPELKVLFMSGYTDDEMLRRGFTEDAAALIQKPFAAGELARRVSRRLATGGESVA